MKVRHTNLLGIAAIAGFAAILVFPALAESISPAFDGRYEGSGRLLAHLSQSGCPKAPESVDVTISKGNIRGKAADGGRIEAFVTTDGFFTGTYRFADGARTAFEGRIDDGSLVGSAIKGETCAYLLTLNRK